MPKGAAASVQAVSKPKVRSSLRKIAKSRKLAPACSTTALRSTRVMSLSIVFGTPTTAHLQITRQAPILQWGETDFPTNSKHEGALQTAEFTTDSITAALRTTSITPGCGLMADLCH